MPHWQRSEKADAQIRLHSQPLPKLPDITTFRDEPIQALDDPEIQKTAISGLIDEIIVHPTAALDIQYSFKACFQTIALRRIIMETVLFKVRMQFARPPRGMYPKAA